MVSLSQSQSPQKQQNATHSFDQSFHHLAPCQWHPSDMRHIQRQHKHSGRVAIARGYRNRSNIFKI